MSTFVVVFLSAFVAWELLAVATAIATRFIPSLQMPGGKTLSKGWVSHLIALIVWTTLLVLAIFDPFGLGNLVSRVDSGLFEFIAWGLLIASVVAVLVASFRGATGGKSAGMYFLAVLLLLLGGFLHWNPFNWTTPRIAAPNEIQTSSVNDLNPVQLGAPNQMEVLITQIQANGGTPYLDALHDAKKIDEALYQVLKKEFELRDTDINDVKKILADGNAKSNRNFSTLYGATVQNTEEINGLKAVGQKRSQDANEALLKELQALKNSLNPAPAVGVPGSVEAPLPAPAPAVATGGQGWRTWRNNSGLDLYFDRFGPYWKAGASYTSARHLVSPGQSIEESKRLFQGDFSPLVPGDYGVLTNESRSKYYDLDGREEHNGVYRDGWAVATDGTIHQGFFIRQGEDPYNVNLAKRPTNTSLPAVYFRTVEGDLIRLRNTGE